MWESWADLPKRTSPVPNTKIASAESRLRAEPASANSRLSAEPTASTSASSRPTTFEELADERVAALSGGHTLHRGSEGSGSSREQPDAREVHAYTTRCPLKRRGEPLDAPRAPQESRLEPSGLLAESRRSVAALLRAAVELVTTDSESSCSDMDTEEAGEAGGYPPPAPSSHVLGGLDFAVWPSSDDHGNGQPHASSPISPKRVNLNL